MFSLGTTTTLSVGAPPGTYFLRLRTQNVCGQSLPSNEVVLTVAPIQTPGPSTNLAATVTGRSVVVTWHPPASGVVTGYILQAGSTSGLSNLAILSLGLQSSFTAPNVSPGTYYLRALAVNTAGAGPPSAEIIVVVP